MLSAHPGMVIVSAVLGAWVCTYLSECLLSRFWYLLLISNTCILTTENLYNNKFFLKSRVSSKVNSRQDTRDSGGRSVSTQGSEDRDQAAPSCLCVFSQLLPDSSHVPLLGGQRPSLCRACLSPEAEVGTKWGGAGHAGKSPPTRHSKRKWKVSGEKVSRSAGRPQGSPAWVCAHVLLCEAHSLPP